MKVVSIKLKLLWVQRGKKIEFKSGRNIRKVYSKIDTNLIMLFSPKNTFLASIILWKKWNSLTGFMKTEYA